LQLRSLQTTAPLDPTPNLPLTSPHTPVLNVTASSSSPSPASSFTPSSSSKLLHIPGLPNLLPPNPFPELPTTTQDAVSRIRAQSTPATGIYITARLHSRTYLLHPRDILTVPLLKPLQAPGTLLALTRIEEVGSREYAIRSPAAEGKSLRKTVHWTDRFKLPNLPPWIVKCDLTVLEHTRSPLQTHFKKKRRKGYQKTIRTKSGWTRLRVGDIVLGDGVPPS
jgi:large subunit ribosomal protein L21